MGLIGKPNVAIFITGYRIKVWINKGEILEHDPYAHDKRMNDQGDTRSRGGNDRNDRGGRDRRPARAN